MPAHPANYVAKLVSVDQLVKYQLMTNGRIQETIVNRFVMPLRPTAELSDPLDTMDIRQRVYRVQDTEWNDRLQCHIVTYKEVL